MRFGKRFLEDTIPQLFYFENRQANNPSHLQTTSENIVAKVFLIIKLSFMEIFLRFCIYVFKVFCCRVAVCGKGITSKRRMFEVNTETRLPCQGKQCNEESSKKYGKSLLLQVKLMKKVEKLWQIEKLPIMSNFSFCHNVFKSLLQTRQKASICGKVSSLIIF